MKTLFLTVRNPFEKDEEIKYLKVTRYYDKES